MNRKSDIAIRKKYTEDSVIILGDFNVAGHEMNYVFRVSSFGARAGIEKINVYFSLLDNTKRENVEVSYDFKPENVIIEEQSLMVRAENMEITDSYDCLHAYINYDSFSMDIDVKSYGKKYDAESYLKNYDPTMLGAYVYPDCTTKGNVILSDKYFDVTGNAYVIRKYQYKEANMFTGLLRRTSSDDLDYNSMMAFMVLNNDTKIFMGSYGGDKKEDFMIGISPMGFENKLIFEIQNDIDTYVNRSSKTDEPLYLAIMSKDERVNLKFKRKLKKVFTKIVPEDADEQTKINSEIRLYDRFIRVVGVYNREKVSGYGYIAIS